MENANKPQDNGSNSKAMGEIVRYLKNYPFLLITVAGLLILVGILVFDKDKLEMFKGLIYGIVLVPVGLQFLIEFRKQAGKRGAVEKPAKAGKTTAPQLAETDATEAVAVGGSQPFSRKIIVSLVLIAINILAWNETLDANAHLGAIVLLGIPALLLGFSALNDARHGTVKGKEWAIAAIVLSVLMILASLGGLTETKNPTPKPAPAPVSDPEDPVVTPPLPENQPDTTQKSQPSIASVCMTQFGSCPMMVAIPVGSNCTCTTAFGILPGMAQ